MAIEDRIPLVDEILGERRSAMAADFDAYRNHVYRMLNFCFALRDCSEEERQKLIIAGCFHDIGIWTGKTFDYLPPSEVAAKAYLQQSGLEAWAEEIDLMIDLHHKLRRVDDDRYPLIEVFRKGDLVDFSLTTLKCGLPGSFTSSVRRQFPNAGFHKRLVQLEAGWLVKHPLRPLPVLKW